MSPSTPNWHSLSIKDVLEGLETIGDGLTSTEAKKRLDKYGQNRLPTAKVDSLATIFWRQFHNPLIYVLLIAASTVFLLGEPIDASIILFVLVFNAIIGTIQEGKAQNILKALKQLAKTSTTVMRDKEEKILTDEELVPGDIVLLTEGQRVPADVRLIEVFNLAVNESSLTGESIPVHKNDQSIPDSDEAKPLGERHNMAYRGTYIVTGRAKAVVVATGLQTELGKIAQSIESVNTDIPLKRSIIKLTHQIIVAVGTISVLLFVVGLNRGYGIREMFATVVSLAVSAIPEGLPIVLTLVLSTGVWRMSKRQALIKKLNAVEGLGQTTIIAVDKTGTITQNKLITTSLYVDGRHYQISGDGYKPEGELSFEGKALNWAKLSEAVKMAGKIALSNSSAEVIWSPKTKDWQIAGDPTEAALTVFALKMGLDKEKDNPLGKVVKDMPFDYQRKYRAVLLEKDGERFLAVTGALEALLAMTNLSVAEKKRVEKVAAGLAAGGQRVVAFAYKQKAGKIDMENLTDITFGGLFGMGDTLHETIAETVKRVRAAGIAVVMITGDHQGTAEAIARQAGIFKDGDKTLTGPEIEGKSQTELAKMLSKVTVFARVTPEHKQLIVKAYQERGEIIAMTGDGVNDAPSLVAADLGLAMGISGTEVAKEAADIVLLDDNFQSIVAAIEEGRSIYITIKKVIAYLLATSVGELLAIAASLFLGLPLPITAAQIIWLNLVTDGFLDVSLAMEPKDKNLLQERFGAKAKNLIDSLMVGRVILFAITMATGTLWLLTAYDPSDKLRYSSIALTTMAAFQWFNAWNSRDSRKSVFSRDIFSNPYLIAATVTIISLQFAALKLPFLQSILRTEPLTAGDWLICTAVASSALWVEEIRKWLARSKSKNNKRRGK